MLVRESTHSSRLVRQQMVNQQIRTWEVSDEAVLAVFNKVPRDRFVPAGCENVAYADTEIPLPHGQLMLRPGILGRLLQGLQVQKHEKVLEIGSGSGYLTACLAVMAQSVTSLEYFEDLHKLAARNLQQNEVENVTLLHMDAMQELPAGSFDAIAVTGSLRFLDERLVSALSEGGRLFVVLGESPAMRATVITRLANGERQSISRFETDIPPLQLPAARRDFTF